MRVSPSSFRDGPKGPGLESITTDWDYGFRARASGAPGMRTALLLPVGAELLERGLDEAGVEHVLGRDRHRQVAELHVELGGELLDCGVEPAVDAPQILAVEVAHQRLEEVKVEVGQPLMQDRGRLV